MRLKAKYLTLLTQLLLHLSLTDVENKIPNVSNLVKKTKHTTNISEMENKITTDYDHNENITIQGHNKLTTENFTASLK